MDDLTNEQLQEIIENQQYQIEQNENEVQKIEKNLCSIRIWLMIIGLYTISKIIIEFTILTVYGTKIIELLEKIN